MEKHKGMNKYETLLKCQADPVFFARTMLGVKTLTWQGHIDILNAIAVNHRITIKSGHSMGKDWLAGLIAVWFLMCHKNSIVITTAPSFRQVDKVMWSEIRNFINSAPVKFSMAKVLQNEIKISDKHYAIGFTTESGGSTGRFQGFKGESILVLATEAQAIDDVIFEQIEGCLTSPISKLYLAGNSLRPDGYFRRSFDDPTFKKFSFACTESPNYLAKGQAIPGMVSYDWVEDKRLRWGEESPLWNTRVLAEFPDIGINTLISYTQVQRATKCTTPAIGYKVIAVDPARYGSDDTAIAIAQGGEILSLTTVNGRATTDTSDNIITLIKQHHPDKVIIDMGAMGAGIYDMVRRAIDQGIRDHANKIIPVDLIGYNFGGRAIRSDYYANSGTESYDHACKAIIADKVKLPVDDELCLQLISRKYIINDKGIMQLESKSKMADSPDKADAVVMALTHSLTSQEIIPREMQDELDYDMDNMQTNEYGYPKGEWSQFD